MEKLNMKENKLKVYAIYTNSHKELFEKFFLPSLANTDLELHATEIKQVGTGDFNTKNYLNSILLKVQTIIQAIKENIDGVFVYSDVDIIFFRKVSDNLLSRLKDKDIVFQSDVYTDIYMRSVVNTGFFICRANDKTLKLWRECEKRLRKNISSGTKSMHDQDFINQIIREDPKMVNFDFLPTDKYAFSSWGELENGFSVRKEYMLAKRVCTFHAICTNCVKDKKFLLKKVKTLTSNKSSVIILKYYRTIYLEFIYGMFGKIGLVLKKYFPLAYRLLKPYFPNKNERKKLKVYAIYTDSHKELFEKFFLPSLANTDLELHAQKVTQCGTGEFMSSGWLESMLLKTKMVIDAIEENFGQAFVFSDVDIIFFKNVSDDLLSRLKDKDILFQSNGYNKFEVNCGFFVCHANIRTLKLWQECEKKLIINISLGIKINEQDIINEMIKNNPEMVNFGVLPTKKYSFTEGGELENGFSYNKVYLLTKSAYTCHAIYTVGTKNKELLLSKVRGLTYISIWKYYRTIYLEFIYGMFGKIGLVLKKYFPLAYRLLKPYFPNKK